MLTEHSHVPGTVLSEEYSLYHLILTTHCNTCYSGIHTSKHADSSNLVSKILALFIAGPPPPHASYSTSAFSDSDSSLPRDLNTTPISDSKPPH